MPRATARKERWKESPDDRDYPAAEDFLSLITSPAAAKAIARRLRVAPLVHRRAKDLLRASRLPLLGPDNFHVAKDLKKVAQGRLLSPVLCVRGTLLIDVPQTTRDSSPPATTGFARATTSMRTPTFRAASPT